MPYSSVREIPAWVRRKVSAKRQRQWMHVWNSMFQRTGSETRSFKAAAAAIKARLKEKRAS